MKKTIDLENYLKHFFNYDTFHKGQKEIIEDVLKGHNVFGVLPTGSGKSLCYQLPAKILNGTTIVVSPLISLMIDQVKYLKSIYYKDVVALNSFIKWQDRQIALQNLANYSLVYISPELLQDDNVLNQLQKIKVSLFVIDEAHCVSQWGHEFRTDYLRLPGVLRALGNPTTLALSATAPESIQEDTISLLNLKDVKRHIHPIDRSNISFVVEKVNNEKEKTKRIVELLHKRRVPTIIYFLSRQRSEEVAARLSEKLPNQKVAFYHGGMESIDRINIQQQFMNDQIDIICCTSAFGMGINKHNIRLVIHFHLPIEIESFIQETGRAGRDGEDSVSLSFYNESDFFFPVQMIQKQLPNESEINHFFSLLYKMHLEKNHFSITDMHSMVLTQLTETQVQFLTYHLEKHGIIKDSTIFYNKTKWHHAKNKIIKFSEERLTYKQTNLNSILNWIRSEDCFRKSLYLLFQNSYTVRPFQCCSNCYFSFDDWVVDETIREQKVDLSWQEKLAQLLLIGDCNETK